MDQNIPAWKDSVLTPVDKLEVHRQGLRHLAVSVFVMRGPTMLLQQRALNKYHTPGLWTNSCCTHPAWGEAALDCAIRRLKEELGITGLHPHFRHRLEYRAEVGGGMIEHELVDVFVAEAPTALTLTPEKTEVQATRWMTIPEVQAEITQFPERFTPWFQIYLRDHLTEILPD